MPPGFSIRYVILLSVTVEAYSGDTGDKIAEYEVVFHESSQKSTLKRTPRKEK